MVQVRASWVFVAACCVALFAFPVLFLMVTLDTLVQKSPFPRLQHDVHGREGADNDSILFIHVPKAGGTTLTGVLREIQCKRNSRKFADCCRNPGSCYIKAYRRCISILGCVSHYPRSHLIRNVSLSVAVFREPVARTVSGWFYAGHNPNNDAFEVDPHFLEIRKGNAPRVTFEEYIHYSAYTNVQTRMLGANSFPYRNVTVDVAVLRKAKRAVDELFCVALQEELAVSAMLLTRRTGLATFEWDARLLQMPAERAVQSSQELAAGKVRGDRNGTRGKAVNAFTPESRQHILTDPETIMEIRSLNRYDTELYEHAVKKFCEQVRAFPDLLLLLQKLEC